MSLVARRQRILSVRARQTRIALKVSSRGEWSADGSRTEWRGMKAPT